MASTKNDFSTDGKIHDLLPQTPPAIEADRPPIRNYDNAYRARCNEIGANTTAEPLQPLVATDSNNLGAAERGLESSSSEIIHLGKISCLIRQHLQALTRGGRMYSFLHYMVQGDYTPAGLLPKKLSRSLEVEVGGSREDLDVDGVLREEEEEEEGDDVSEVESWYESLEG